MPTIRTFTARIAGMWRFRMRIMSITRTTPTCTARTVTTSTNACPVRTKFMGTMSTCTPKAAAMSLSRMTITPTTSMTGTGTRNMTVIWDDH